MDLKNPNIYYIGWWKEGFKDGYGVEGWENGDVYKGKFENNKKRGSGVINTKSKWDIDGVFDENGDGSGTASVKV